MRRSPSGKSDALATNHSAIAFRSEDAAAADRAAILGVPREYKRQTTPPSKAEIDEGIETVGRQQKRRIDEAQARKRQLRGHQGGTVEAQARQTIERRERKECAERQVEHDIGRQPRQRRGEAAGLRAEQCHGRQKMARGSKRRRTEQYPADHQQYETCSDAE